MEIYVLDSLVGGEKSSSKREGIVKAFYVFTNCLLMQIIHKKEVYYSLVRIGRFESFMRHEFDSLMTEICLTFYIHKLRAKVSFFIFPFSPCLKI